MVAAACSSDVGFAIVIVAVGIMVALVKVGHGLKVYWIAKAVAIDPKIGQRTNIS